MSALAKYKERAVSARKRERMASQRTVDVAIESVGGLAGAVLAGRLELEPIPFMGYNIDPGVIAALGVAGLEISGATDRGVIAKGSSATLFGYALGRVAIASQTA